MKTNGNGMIQWIHMVGGSVLVVTLVTLFYITLTNRGEQETQIRTLTTAIGSHQDTFHKLQRQRAELAARLLETRSVLSTMSPLPDATPMATYMNRLSELAAGYGLQVTGNTPLQSRRYPGLLERPFLVELTGTYPGLIRFLTAVEGMDAWADVSHLSIRTDPSKSSENPRTRSALLTFNLFTAERPEDKAAKGGGS